jgi:SAM-dependent MidA family methyltransferase
MLEPDPLSSLPAAKRAQSYPIAPISATPSLARILRDRIASYGPMSFSEFMASALYDPGFGYYARGARQIGRGGDFFTSVSVGPLFGGLLARRFLREWQTLGCPERWRIIECGAHDGTLAADVLNALSLLEPHALKGLDYVIPEPLDTLQNIQRETLRDFPKTVRFFQTPAQLADDPLPGIAFGNEVLDALPCHLVEWRGDRWLECRVGIAAEDRLIWNLGEIDNPQLISALAPLGRQFPEAYRTEIRIGYQAFLEPLVRSLDAGRMLWIDYGFARSDYYHPQRSSGTLRTFSKHRAGDDPLEFPGETDITAHVDFTAVAEVAAELGGQATEFRNQGAWLTEIAREWLLEQDGAPQPSLLRQFQTLTHPGHLGGSFHVLELTWKQPANIPNPAHLAHHLFGEA